MGENLFATQDFFVNVVQENKEEILRPKLGTQNDDTLEAFSGSLSFVSVIPNPT